MRADGQSYYRVDVEIHMETDRGKTKKYVEQYLTLATGVTEAETQTVKNFKEVGDIRDYRIKGVSETKIVDVI